MTDDQFAVIGHDENGHPKIRYYLDPREVTIIRDPERDGEVIGYIWEPVGPVPSPIRAVRTPLTDEDLKQRWLAAWREKSPTWRYPSIGVEGIDVHEVDMEEQRGPRRRWWRRRP